VPLLAVLANVTARLAGGDLGRGEVATYSIKFFCCRNILWLLGLAECPAVFGGFWTRLGGCGTVFAAFITHIVLKLGQRAESVLRISLVPLGSAQDSGQIVLDI